MVVNHSDKWIYLAAPKTGSSTLHYLLSYPPFNGECQGISSNRIEIDNQHAMTIPVGCEDYKVLISVRNPYSRAVSLYSHHSKYFPDMPESASFSVYVEQMLGRTSNDFFGWTQTEWYASVPRVDHVIRLECLRDDIRGLTPCPFSVPWENRISDKTWQYHYRTYPGTLEQVRAWGQPDFEAYGYGR